MPQRLSYRWGIFFGGGALGTSNSKIFYGLVFVAQCAEEKVPGQLGAACLEGGLCSETLDCVDDVCADQGASEQVGLDPATESSTLKADVLQIDSSSVLQIVSRPDTQSLVVSGDTPIKEGDVIYSGPTHGDVYAKVVNIAGSSPARTLTIEEANLEELYDELVVRQETAFDWDTATISGEWASKASVCEPNGAILVLDKRCPVEGSNIVGC